MKNDGWLIYFAVFAGFVYLYFMSDSDGTTQVSDPDDNGPQLNTVYSNTVGVIGAFVSGQTASPACIAAIRAHEGCKLVAYWDVEGYSIGYGHQSGLIVAGQTCTQAQADAWLAQDVANATACVLKYVQVPLSQNQLDALVDFVYSLGSGNFASSTLLKVLNQGNYTAVPAQMRRWCNVAGVPNQGALARREAEIATWNGTGS